MLGSCGLVERVDKFDTDRARYGVRWQMQDGLRRITFNPGKTTREAVLIRVGNSSSPGTLPTI